MKPRVPPRFHEATWKSVDKKLFKELADYANRLGTNVTRGVGVLVCGPPGVGKTWALAALTRLAVDTQSAAGRRYDHEFVTAPDLFDNLNEFDQSVYDEYREQTWRETYTTVPWLVINDLGKEYRGGKINEQASYKLGRILRARSERRLVTHVSTNFKGPDLTETYGKSIVSLMSEMMVTMVVIGPDRRGT